MEVILPILFAVIVGLAHAFEPDHLIAVSNIVSKRDSLILAMKDGLYWGLGHTTTLVIFGSILILFRLTFLKFNYFEVGVGVMLIAMGLARLFNANELKFFDKRRYKHQFAYSIGLIHGLAGSGALVLLVMSEIRDPYLSILYLLVFGSGSIVGMFIAASLFYIPFTQRMRLGKSVKFLLVKTSSAICIIYGSWMIYHNL